MAKILISSIGAGNKDNGAYSKAKYKIDGETYETSFVADALNRHLDFDKIFLIGTKKSIWDEAYMVFGGENEEYLENLYEKKEEGKIDEEVLKEFEETLPFGLKPIIIKYGLDDEELWENFSEFLGIAQNIEDNDELYLDITHSFRSLALMSFVMAQFARTISNKKFKIEGVFYAMFEYVRENKEGITPIVDIKILIDIQEWIKAIDAIKNYSDFNPLIELLEGKEVEKDVKNTFINLNNTIGIANIHAIRQFIKLSVKKIKNIQNSGDKVIKLLAPEILELVNELDKEKESDFQYSLAKWFYKNRNYALSYIALYEAVITKSCELSNLDFADHNMREEAKRSIGDDKYGKHFYTKYDNSLSVIRNSIVHQSAIRENNQGIPQETKDMVDTDIKKLKTFIDIFEDYFKVGNKE